jgi:hypothetical protein
VDGKSTAVHAPLIGTGIKFADILVMVVRARLLWADD